MIEHIISCNARILRKFHFKIERNESLRARQAYHFVVYFTGYYTKWTNDSTCTAFAALCHKFN